MVDFEPAPAEKPSSSRTLLIVAVVGCLAVVALLAVCGGGFGYFLYQGKVATDTALDEFQGKLDAKDYASAYALIAPEWQAKQTREEFEELFTMIDDVMGKYKSRSMASVNVNQAPGGSIANATYKVEYEKGSGQLAVVLKESGGRWHVLGYQLNSDNFEKRLKCPSCGFQNQNLGKFCTNCGKPL